MSHHSLTKLLVTPEVRDDCEELALCGPSHQPLLCRHGCRTVIASRNLQRVSEVSLWAPPGQAGRRKSCERLEILLHSPLGGAGSSAAGEMAYQCCPVFSWLEVLQHQQAAVMGRMGLGLGWAAPTAPHGGAQLIVELATFPHQLWGCLFQISYCLFLEETERNKLW